MKLIKISAVFLLVFGFSFAFNPVYVDAQQTQSQSFLGSFTDGFSAISSYFQRLSSALGLSQAASVYVSSPESRSDVFLSITSLERGDSMPEVEELQKLLSEYSDVYLGVPVTGYFGPRTEEAVMEFQRRHGLEVTGRVDERTMDHLREAVSLARERDDHSSIPRPLVEVSKPGEVERVDKEEDEAHSSRRCRADLSNDGAIGQADMDILFNSWGPCANPDNCPADLNNDGVVNVLDLLLLLEEWNEGCSEYTFDSTSSYDGDHDQEKGDYEYLFSQDDGLDIDIFTNSSGNQSFTAHYNGTPLRLSYPDEAFFEPRSNHLDQLIETGSGTGDSPVVEKPADLQEGDLIIILLGIFNNPGVIDVPEGFHLIRAEKDDSSVDRPVQKAYWKVATGNEPESYSFLLGDDIQSWRTVSLRVIGADTENPIADHSGVNSGSTNVSSLEIPEVTAESSSNLLIAARTSRGNPQSVDDGLDGMTQIASQNSSGGGPTGGGHLTTREYVSSGSTDSRLLEWGVSRRSTALMFSINMDESITSDDLSVDYNILEKPGGVDVVYNIYNPTSLPQIPPDLRVDGFMNSMDNSETDYLHIVDYGNLVSFDKTNVVDGINTPGPDERDRIRFRRYPGSQFPVTALVDDNFAVGSSINYPFLDYLHQVSVQIDKNVEGPQAGSWSHSYLDLDHGHATDGDVLIQPGQHREYVVPVRFSSPRNWIFTLHPYKEHFQELYDGGSGGSIKDRDIRPVFGWNLSNTDSPNCDGIPWWIHNTRRYNCNTDLWDESLGWGAFLGTGEEEGFLNSVMSAGFERAMIWLAAGKYTGCCNMPSQFMNFLPHLEETDHEFEKFAENDLELGFWWGRAGQVPNPLDFDGWDPASIEPANINDPSHKAFLLDQLEKAVDRGADLIGLDAYGAMGPSQGYFWADYLKENLPEITFVTEPSRPDFINSKIANWHYPTGGAGGTNWYDPNGFNIVPGGVLEGPSVMSWYLNPGAEIFLYVRSMPDWVDEKAYMQDLISWGFTPIPMGLSAHNTDVSDFSYDLVPCFNGESPDWPYDKECDSPLSVPSN